MAEIGKVTPGEPLWPWPQRPGSSEKEEQESPKEKEGGEDKPDSNDDNDKKDDGHIDVYV